MSETHYADMLCRDLGEEVMCLFEQPDVTELGQNPYGDMVWAKRRGMNGLQPTDVRRSKAHVQMFLNRAADANGFVLGADRSVVECALPEARFSRNRLAGHVPPNVAAPRFNLRKLPAEAYPLESYLDAGTFTEGQYGALTQAIADHKNIGVVGPAQTGKTTLGMSILRYAGELSPEEHIITMEQTPELRVTPEWRWTPFYVTEGVDYSTLIERSLRASGGRLVLGECRGPSILDLLNAFMSGYDGGLFTFHSSSVQKALKRILHYCLRASNTDTHRHTIGDAIDLMIVLTLDGDTRRAGEMVYVRGYDDDTGYDLAPIH